jgi:hypothetical protein
LILNARSAAAAASAADRPAAAAIPAQPADSRSAADRLAASRERLRQALQNGGVPPDRPQTDRPGEGAVAALIAALKSVPGSGILIDAVCAWWERHPLRIAGTLAGEAAQVVIQTLARRNPIGLVVGALIMGGLLAWVRPWRWIIKPMLFAGLAEQLFNKAIAKLAEQREPA